MVIGRNHGKEDSAGGRMRFLIVREVWRVRENLEGSERRPSRAILDFLRVSILFTVLLR
jgi:hypothetical protein